MKVQKVRLNSAITCKLGEGVQGKVCLHASVSGKKLYAVKTTSKRKNNIANLSREKLLHMEFYYSLPTYLKRFFAKPVVATFPKKGPQMYHAMEQVPNATTLAKFLINAMKTNDTKGVNRVIRQVRHACYALWTHGYIHGDLHFNNVLVNKKTRNIKVIDFGFARRTNSIHSTQWKTGKTNMLSKLDNKFARWFRSEWRSYKISMGVKTGNPNAFVFNNTIDRSNYYYGPHYNLMRSTKSFMKK